MKRIKIYLAIAITACITVGSCERMKLLEERPYKTSTNSYPNNYEEIVSMINAIYRQYNRVELFKSPAFLDPEAYSDLIYGRGTFAASYTTGITEACVGRGEKMWAVFYRIVRYSNQILSRLTVISDNLSEKEMADALAETRFLRALSYSYLAKFYGGVPLYKEDDDVIICKGRTLENEIWQFVRDEARYCVENLPDRPRELGRPGLAAACWLLAEASMYLQDYSTAAQISKKAIDLGVYSLVRLTEPKDFDKLFAYGSPKGTDHSEEVWYIKYNAQVNSDVFARLVATEKDMANSPVKANSGVLALYTDYENNKKIKEWDKDDYRYQYNLYIPKSACGLLDAQTPTGMMIIKYNDYDTSTKLGHNDYPIIRYTDILFQYAECASRVVGAPTEEAMEIVNMVRRRAYGQNPKSQWSGDYKLSDYSTLEKFMTVLLKEKGYETFAEGKRWFDLKRLGLLAQYALDAGKIQSIDEVTERAMYWPIPAQEFSYNKVLDPTKDQNPGW